MYKIVYVELTADKAHLCRRPGKQPHIVLDKTLKRDVDATLDALIRLISADQALTKREKLQERVIFLDDVSNPLVTQGFRQPVMGQAADFCPN